MEKGWYRWDLLGGALTLACAIHCALTPILLLSLPVFATEGFDHGVALTLIAIASIAILGGAYQHRRFNAILPFVVGAVLLSLRHSAGPIGSPPEIAVSLVAAAFFLYAHAINYGHCRQAHDGVSARCAKA